MSASGSPVSSRKRASSKGPSSTSSRRGKPAAADGSSNGHDAAHVTAPTHAASVPPTPATNISHAAAASHVEYEFGGPYIGPIGILFGLPILVWGVTHYCTGSSWTSLPTSIPSWHGVFASFTTTDMLLYTGWWLFQAALHLLVPGRVVNGVVLKDGSKLKYCVNGWNCLLVTVAACLALHFGTEYKLTYICDHIEGLAIASIIFSTLLSIYLYAASFAPGAALADGGNSGIAIYDFFIGRELNPRVLGGALDLKFFCELRPGLFGWWLINTAMLLKQSERPEGVSVAMLIVYTLQALYIADSVYCEDCILTTIDIIQDGFGFMLAFGDLAWVPFMYSLQARYLADNDAGMSNFALAISALVGVAGFYIFRAANAQKDTFKTSPDHDSVKNLKCIKTSRGGRLLCDGWWGVSRHINYFGDWLLSVGMSLPTGFVTPVTYFYPAYFAVLLIHREMRDEHKCATKYGADWVEYKKRVPYRIIPGVY